MDSLQLKDYENRFNLRPFMYSAYFTNISAGAESIQSVVIRENTAFVVFRMDAWCYVYTTYGTAAYATVLITDSGTGRNWMDRALPLNLLAGFYQHVQPWEVPYTMGGNASMQFTLKSLESTNALDAYVVLFGAHLYTK